MKVEVQNMKVEVCHQVLEYIRSLGSAIDFTALRQAITAAKGPSCFNHYEIQEGKACGSRNRIRNGTNCRTVVRQASSAPHNIPTYQSIQKWTGDPLDSRGGETTSPELNGGRIQQVAHGNCPLFQPV
ncbi:MAG: hypothetical protein Q9212_006445 [Teloschistes hypoglaucus]